MADKAIPLLSAVDWVAVDIQRPSRSVVVKVRLYFDARTKAAKLLQVPLGRVRLSVVCDGESVEQALVRVRTLVAHEQRQQEAGHRQEAAGAARGRLASS